MIRLINSLHLRVVALFHVVTLSLTAAADAQETRAELLRQARVSKQATLRPYKPNVLETALRTIETEGLLIFRDGFYPKIGSLTTGSGFAWGVGYRNRRLFNDEATIDTWAGVSATKYWALESRLRFPMLADGRVMVEAYARRHEYPREDYFGLGPASLRRNQTDYTLRNNTFGARAGLRPLRFVTLGGGTEYLQPRIGNGQDDTIPSIRDIFDAQSAPGLSQESNFVRASAFVDIDWRRPINARNGGWYRVEWSHYGASDELHTFQRVDVDIRQFVSFLSERRVLFGRVAAATTSHASGQEVPFYFMSTLGGNDSLRGYRDYRFRGPHALLLQGEYRFEIWSGLDGALFYEAGKVALRRGGVNLRNLETDYGFGFRFNTDNGVVLRVDAAFGSRDGRHLWIVFGGTF